MNPDTFTEFSNRYSKQYSDYLMRNLGGVFLKPRQWRQQLEKSRLNFSLMRLAKKARYTKDCVNLFGNNFELVDNISFLWTYIDIFERQIYNFKSSNSRPTIIDCGANIGLSILYFKQLYPDSQVIAFEPDCKIFNVLQKNVKNFGFSNVELIQKAVWSSETVLEFMSEGSDSGRLVQIESDQKKYQVSTVRLRDYLTKPIDLLKIDVEGAEIELIKDCSDLLFNVKNLFIEYHSFANEPQQLSILIKLLDESGFRLYIQSSNSSDQPFVERKATLGMDMLLNIFAFRDS